MPTWLTRGTAPQRRRPRSALAVTPLPLPQAEQSALPPDVNAQLKQPGFTLGHVLETSVARAAHPLDGDRGSAAARRAMVQRILSKIGMRGQTFANFRADVEIQDELILPYNPMRNYVIIVNTGANTIFVAFERAADSATGVPIVSGGSYEPILGTVSSVHLISAVAGQQAVIVEGFYTWAGARALAEDPIRGDNNLNDRDR